MTYLTSEERWAGLHPAYPIPPLGREWRQGYRRTTRRLALSLTVYGLVAALSIAGAWRVLGVWSGLLPGH